MPRKPRIEYEDAIYHILKKQRKKQSKEEGSGWSFHRGMGQAFYLAIVYSESSS